MAQAMAGQQAQNMQQASVSIGQQEQANQVAERNMTSQLQTQEAAGELQSRAAEKEKNDTLFGMSQNRVGAANEAMEAQKQAIIGGIGDMATGAAGMSGIAGKLPGFIKDA
jgi:hypothetical protein